MITIDEKRTIISGELSTILTELTIGLNKVYNLMKSELGEDKAKPNMVMLGKFAIMSEREVERVMAGEEMVEF